jgi:prevent-host-death family protein
VQIGVRELRAGLAGFLRRAAAGESFVVTVSGRPAAVLGPLGGASRFSLEDLVAAGAVAPPRSRARRTGPGDQRARLPVDARSDAELRRIR